MGQVSESSEGPGRRIGISDARVEISRFIVMVQRSGIESRGTATGSVIFFLIINNLYSAKILKFSGSSHLTLNIIIIINIC